MNNIVGDFIGNKSSANSGAIYTNTSTIDDISGNFSGNTGASIFNHNNSLIKNISGNFTNNPSYAIVNNWDSTINKIEGNFINNKADSGGAAINNLTSRIDEIKGNFVNNSTKGNSGAIFNGALILFGGGPLSYPSIGAIEGNFIGNSGNIETTSEGGEQHGGAIGNSGFIESIKGNFKNNFVYGYSAGGGAISNGDTINKIYNSKFISNYAQTNSEGGGAYGGAIYNTGKMTIVDSVFENNSAKFGGAIANKNSTLNIVANDSDTVFTNNTDSTGLNAIYQYSSGTEDAVINLNTGNANIIINDGISGSDVHVDKQIVNINKSDVILNDGSVAPAVGVVKLNDKVENSTVNMYAGTLEIGGTLADSVTFNYDGGTVSMQNGRINSANFGELNLRTDMDLKLDADFSGSKSIDTISVKDGGFTSNGHKINISNINILKPITDKQFSLQPVSETMSEGETKENLMSVINYTGDDIIYSPIYKYSAKYDSSKGAIDFGLASIINNDNPSNDTPDNSGETNAYEAIDSNTEDNSEKPPVYDDFNPAVLSGAVAAQFGGYITQLNSYNQAFRNMDTYMLMAKRDRNAMKMRNRYASAGDDLYYEEGTDSKDYSEIWFRPYATFENVPFKNGPKVSNIGYASFFGGDSPMYELSHGFDAMWGVYAGYNGSHQNYDGVSIFQNGGTLGLIGTLYKGNFFTGLTANTGASSGRANIMYGADDFTLFMSGVAAKAGYNFEMADGKFIIQPSYTMSYSFVNTYDYTSSSGVKIDSSPLNAIQIEPGIKFIANLKNGWQPYTGVSVVWNAMDKTKFQAADVNLPSLSIKPFVEYGVGARKSWGERLTGFFQVFVKNGGRNGVTLQAGFSWAVGKKKPKNNSKLSSKASKKLKVSSTKKRG